MKKTQNQRNLIFLVSLAILIVIAASMNLGNLVGQAPKAVPSKLETTGTGSFRGGISAAQPVPVATVSAPIESSPVPSPQPVAASQPEVLESVIPPASPEFDGYIVELQTPSLLEVNAKLEKEIKSLDDQIARIDSQVRVRSLRASVAPSNLQDSKAVLEEHKNQKIQQQQEHKQRLSQEKASFIASITPSQNRIGAAIRTMSGTHEPQINVRESFDVAVNGLLVEGTAEDVATLQTNPEVKRITPNYKIQPMLIDSVPLIAPLPVLQALTDPQGQPITGKGIRIGVLDTGVDYSHAVFGNCALLQLTDNNPATCPKFGPSFDFYGDGVTTDNDPMDVAGHGTHVAATTAGKGALPDGRRIDGVAPDATIYAYKVFGLKNGVIDGNSGHVLAAIGRASDLDGDGLIGIAEDGDTDGISAKDDRLDVIVLSLGGKGDADDAMSRAIDNAVSNGIIAVIAAGNEGPDPETVGSPGAARKALTVGSTCDKFYSWQKDGLTFRRCIHGPDSISKFSSRGPAPGGTIKPDVLAPGELITAAWPALACNEPVLGSNLQSPPGFCTIQGTSMATPHVGGAAALLKQKNPDWNPEEIKAALKMTAVNLALTENEQGAGRIDVIRALQLAKPPTVSLKMPKEIREVVTLPDKISTSNAQTYELFYTPRSSPDARTVITNDLALPTFDSKTAPDGEYFITATVTGNGLSYKDSALVKINNLQITQPQDKAFIQSNLEIKGNNYFNNPLTIEYGRGLAPETWQTTGITVDTLQLSSASVPEVRFGAFDTSVITEEDFYTIRVRSGNSEERVTIYVTPQGCSDGRFSFADTDADDIADVVERCACANGACTRLGCTGTQCPAAVTLKKVTLDPNGGSVSIDGKTFPDQNTPDNSVNLPVGSRHLLGVVNPPPPPNARQRFVFDRWEPAVQNSVIAVTSDITYKSLWKQQQQLTIGSKPAGAGIINIPSTTWQDIGGTVTIEATPVDPVNKPFIEWQDCTPLTCTCISKNPSHALQMNVQTTRERFIIALFDPAQKVCS